MLLFVFVIVFTFVVVFVIVFTCVVVRVFACVFVFLRAVAFTISSNFTRLVVMLFTLQLYFHLYVYLQFRLRF